MSAAKHALRGVSCLSALALLGASNAAFAAGADLGQAVKQPTNWTAIIMFAAFVIFTLFVIVFTVVITGIYVRRANKQFDDLTSAIQARVQA